MRIRIILTAVAAPAITAAALLATAGGASAAVTPAVLTAQVQKPAAVTITGHTHESNLADTTNLPGNAANYPAIQWDPTYGPVWAHDNLERTVTAVQDAPGSLLWHVTVESTGTFAATANPITGAAWPGGSGSVKGWIKYDVTSTAAPDAKKLPAQTTDGSRSGDLAVAIFGGPDSDAKIVPGSPSPYHFEYRSIPGATDGPGGLYVQNG